MTTSPHAQDETPRNPHLVAPVAGDLSPIDLRNLPLLDGAERVTPLLPDRTVGRVRADGQDAHALALAVSATGEVLFLNLVGQKTTLGAIVGRLFNNKPVTFLGAEDLPWGGAVGLTRLRAGSYTHTGAANRRLGQTNLIVYPTSLSVDDGVRSPTTVTIARDATGTPIPPDPKQESPFAPRVILANTGEAAPAASRFLGTLYAMRIPFPRTPDDQARWAAILWAYGLQTPVTLGSTQMLITPAHAELGVRAWEICGHPRMWWGLLSRLVQERVLLLTTFAA